VTVVDTSPLNYLILIEVIDRLPLWWGESSSPPRCFDELTDDGAPRRVSEWAMMPPE
jgi:hypothetical protein